MREKTFIIVFCGGGTGGHIFPITAVAQAIDHLKGIRPVSLHYAGPVDPFSEVAFRAQDITMHKLLSGKLRRYFSFRNIFDMLFFIPVGLLQSVVLLMRLRPILVFSKGGPGALQVTVAARTLGIPVFIHESDSVPGLSNRAASPWAKKVFTSFPKTEVFNEARVVVTGNPVMGGVSEGSVHDAKELFHLQGEQKLLLVLGGSQGAAPLNEFLLDLLPTLVKDYEIIHITGPKNYNEISLQGGSILTDRQKRYYHCYGFLNHDELCHAMSAADLIVSRAGSSAIFEIAANGKPSILVPLPSASANHQVKNAYQYLRAGACIVIEQSNLQPHFFLSRVQSLLADKNILSRMSKAAFEFSRPLAARTIAREILEYCDAVMHYKTQE